MTSRRFVKYISAGQIRNEFIIDETGKAHNNILGGSLLYAAAALNHWGGLTGLLGVVSQDFKYEKFDMLLQSRFDTRGIKVIPEVLEHNAFFAYPQSNERNPENPVAVYADRNLQLPRELLDYASNGHADQQALPGNRIFLEDIPLDYLDASAAHICPLELSAQLQISTLLQRGSVRTITIQPHPGSMTADNFEDMAILSKDTTAIVTCETDLRGLFKVLTDDLWEMMERLSSYGSQIIIVKNLLNGYSLYERIHNKKYWIPAYPAKRIDPTGEMDVFGGAFTAILHETYDPLHALFLGAAAASIKSEGTGPFSLEQSLPGLDKARMESLHEKLVRY